MIHVAVSLILFSDSDSPPQRATSVSAWSLQAPSTSAWSQSRILRANTCGSLASSSHSTTPHSTLLSSCLWHIAKIFSGILVPQIPPLASLAPRREVPFLSSRAHDGEEEPHATTPRSPREEEAEASKTEALRRKRHQLSIVITAAARSRHRRACSAGAKFGNQNDATSTLTRHRPARPGGAVFARRAGDDSNIAPAGQARR